MVFDCPVCGHKKNIPQTNADRIRATSDEELAAFLSEWAERCLAWYGEYGQTLDWLKQPVKDDEVK